jgi:putative sporulation protein YtaF
MGIALVIALAVSMDSFGVGMAYGLKKIRIPLLSLGIIAFCTGLAMAVSMLFGHLIAGSLTVVTPNTAGAGILIAIGCFHLVQSARKRGQVEVLPVMSTMAREYQADTGSYKTILKINLNLLGLVIQVLKTPDAADLDRSGIISPGESFLLGTALALDAFAAGLAATMTGVPYIVIGLVAVMAAFMVWAGQIIMGRLPAGFLAKTRFLPGVMLVFIGILKIV